MNKMLAVVIALLLVESLHFVFARLLLPYLPPITSSFYYMALAMLMIAFFAGARRRIDWRILRDNAPFFLIIGFLIAFSTSMSFSSVAFVDPGTASMIARMGTIFTLGLGVFWLKERLAGGEIIGALIAVLGVIIISFQPGESGGIVWVGTLMVLASNFSYALHAAIVKRQGGDIEFINFFLFRMVTSVLFLFIFAVGRGEMVVPSGQAVWGILILTAIVNVVISRSLYYTLLRRIDLTILTIVLTLSPVVTVLWSLVLFEERPSLQGVLGGTAVIMGVLLVTVSRSKNNSKIKKESVKINGK